MDKIKLANVARKFIDAFATTLETQDHRHFATALKQAKTTSVQRGPFAQLQHPSMAYLAQLSADVSDPAMQQAIACLDWSPVYDGGGIDSALADGMLAAQAIGTYGVFGAEEVAAGFFMLAPDVQYPMHTHAAREVYHCLAGQVEITHRLHDAAITLRASQSSETPSGRLHSLRTAKSPVLLAYIWTGDLTAPTWWWQQGADRQWLRTAWHRKPGERWKIVHTEPVSEADYAAALT